VLKKITLFIALFSFLVLIVISILLLLGPVVGNVFSNIGNSSPALVWATEIFTWVDENENGIWDANEVPLGDVEITVRELEKIKYPKSRLSEKFPQTTFQGRAAA